MHLHTITEHMRTSTEKDLLSVQITEKDLVVLPKSG